MWMANGRTDDEPWLHFKLTNEPKGSGELKSKERSLKFYFTPYENFFY